MSVSHIRAALRDAMHLFLLLERGVHRNLSGSAGPDKDGATGSDPVSAVILQQARARWAHEGGIDIPEDARLHADDRGLWLSAHVRIGAPIPPIRQEEFVDAIQSLPPVMRELYLLHRQDGLPLAEAGRRLGLGIDDAERLYRSALAGLHARLFDEGRA